jgi:hypothetical protein
MDELKADVVNYAKHGINKPKIWNRPISKVYDLNQKTTNCFYQPMLRYIDEKELAVSYTGFENTPHVREATTLRRNLVEMPSSDQMYEISQRPEEYAGPLRLGNFLVSARATQTKQRNKQTVHVMNQWYRGAKTSESLRWPRGAPRIRDNYIRELSTMYDLGTGKLEPILPPTAGPWSRLE